jgi:hypothetical protein
MYWMRSFWQILPLRMQQQQTPNMQLVVVVGVASQERAL